MTWQNIKDAPQDGTVLIGKGSYDFDKLEPMICAAIKFKTSHKMWFRDNNGYGFTVSCHPTDFMDLPE